MVPEDALNLRWHDRLVSALACWFKPLSDLSCLKDLDTLWKPTHEIDDVVGVVPTWGLTTPFQWTTDDNTGGIAYRWDVAGGIATGATSYLAVTLA